MRKACKQLARTIAALIALPVVLLYAASGALLGRDRVFPGFSQLMSLLPGLSGVYLRWAFYRCVLPECGTDAWIGFGTTFSHRTIRFGNTTYVGVGCMIGDATLEDDVLIGSHVSVVNGQKQHGIERLDVPVREQPGEYPRITIGRDSWIGDRAVVMADVGRHCVVGSGAVVVKPVPDYAIVVGNPARIVRYRNSEAPRPTEDEPSSAGGPHSPELPTVGTPFEHSP
jgi:acetyltransferase-like isoleucine patch superfamily enzyme